MNYCCIIVTYNRKEKLLKNLEHTLAQTIMPSKIFIIDNHGDDKSYDFIAENMSSNELALIQYIYLNKNIGGAGGFCVGLKIARYYNYDTYLLMDDDGYPNDEFTFPLLLEKAMLIKNQNNSFMLNSLVISDQDSNLLSFGLKKFEKVDKLILSYHNKDILYGEINPFNGTLISKQLIDNIGYPNMNFFIKGDEVDFTNRAINHGAFVGTVLKSIYRHPRINNRKQISLFGKKMYVFVESPLKEYYAIRNYTYSYLENNKQKNKVIFNLCKRLFCVLICSCKKIITIKMILKGYKDGKKGKLGMYNENE